MGLSTTTSEEISVGAGDLFYRDYDALDTDPWVAVGATTDDNVWRHTQTLYVPDINGSPGPLAGTDYLQEEGAELEFSVLEMTAAIIALLMPGSESTTATGADVGGGAVGTLSSPITAFQTLAIKVDSVTNLAVGDYIKVGTAGNAETRKVTRVGTTGSGGTGIDVEYPFLLNHASGVAFIEVDGNLGTTITPAVQRRIPRDAYKDYRLDVPGLDGRVTRYFLFDAIMTENAEFTASDSSAAAPRLTLASRFDPANMARGGWQIVKEPQPTFA